MKRIAAWLLILAAGQAMWYYTAGDLWLIGIFPVLMLSILVAMTVTRSRFDDSV